MRIEDAKRIGVLGGGVMGSGIAQTAILAGYKTVVRDLSDEKLNKARETIINGRYGLKGGVERGKITKEEMEKAIANLSLTTKIEELKDCDIIIEAIGGISGELENKEVKKTVFAELDKIIKKEAVFASNTSRFTIADLATATERKDRFIGMHWASPANIMRVVEIIYTADNSKETIKFMEDLCRRLGKTGIIVKDVPGDTGFVGNRIYYAVVAEAEKIVAEGIATKEDVDTIMKGMYNWPAGPFELRLGAHRGWS